MEYNVPDVEIRGPQLQPGRIELINIVTFAPVKPAAGSDVVITVPAGVMWDVQSFRATLTASAAAANRLVGFFVKDQAGTTVYQYQMTNPLTAGLNATYCFSEDCSVAPTAVATTNQLLMPSPRAWFGSGWTFGTTTLNIDVGDAWSALGLWAAEYLPAAGS